MGQYFLLVNETRKEFIRSYCLGYGAKAFEWCANRISGVIYYLTYDRRNLSFKSGDLNKKLYLGRWKGNKIALVGDYFSEDLYDTAKKEYKDISSAVGKEILNLTDKDIRSSDIDIFNKDKCSRLRVVTREDCNGLDKVIQEAFRQGGLFVNDTRKEYICGACAGLSDTYQFLRLDADDWTSGIGLYLLLLTDSSELTDSDCDRVKYAGYWHLCSVRFVSESHKDFLKIVRNYKNITSCVLPEYLDFVDIKNKNTKICDLCDNENRRWNEVVADLFNESVNQL